MLFSTVKRIILPPRKDFKAITVAAILENQEHRDRNKNERNGDNQNLPRTGPWIFAVWKGSWFIMTMGGRVWQ